MWGSVSNCSCSSVWVYNDLLNLHLPCGPHSPSITQGAPWGDAGLEMCWCLRGDFISSPWSQAMPWSYDLWHLLPACALGLWAPTRRGLGKSLVWNSLESSNWCCLAQQRNPRIIWVEANGFASPVSSEWTCSSLPHWSKDGRYLKEGQRPLPSPAWMDRVTHAGVHDEEQLRALGSH